MAFYLLLKIDTNNKSATAPTVDMANIAVLLPSLTEICRKLNIQFPKKLPTIPTNKFPKHPKPRPLIKIPAKKPANIPIIIVHIIFKGIYIIKIMDYFLVLNFVKEQAFSNPNSQKLL